MSRVDRNRRAAPIGIADITLGGVALSISDRARAGDALEGTLAVVVFEAVD